MKVNVTVKRRIVFNGKEYGSVEELPEHVRAAYRAAMAKSEPTTVAAGPVVVNSRTYASVEAMPPEVRRLYEDALAASGAPAGESPRVAATTTGGRAAADVVRSAAAAPIEPGSTASQARTVLALIAALMLVGLLAYLFLR